MIVLKENFNRENLYPFTYTRHTADIFIGAMSIRQKWEQLTGDTVTTDSDEYGIAVPANIIPTVQNYLSILYGDALTKIILFGSQARGEATEDSDIDILIVTKEYLSHEKKEEFYHFMSQLCLNYNVLISSIQMLEDSFEFENSPLLLNIRKEGIIL